MPYTNLDLFTDWDTQGATPTWKRMDRVTGGQIGHDTPPIQRRGIGGEAAIVYGLYVPHVSIEGILQTAVWVPNAKRASINALSAAMQIAGGVKNAGIRARRMQSMYINELTLACAGVDEPVTYSADLIGLEAADLASPSAASVLADKTMEWFQGDVTVNTANYTADSVEVTLRNNYEARGSLDAGTDTQLRWPEYIKVGNMEVEATVVVRTPITIDLSVDEPVDIPFDLVFIMKNDSDTVTLTCTDLYADDDPTPLGTDADEVLWSVPLVGKGNTLAEWTAAVT